MRISVNLASNPYVELGPLYTRLRIAIALLAVLAIPLWLHLHSVMHQSAAAQGRLAAVQGNIQKLEQQRGQLQVDMKQERNAQVLAQSQFLNQIFLRKAFSWTAVMMDLENVLPSGVQVMNIDPVISRDGHVVIRLRVNGAHDRAVLLVRNLEHSHRFLSPRLADESATNAAQGPGGLQNAGMASGVNVDILADYNPLPETTGSPEKTKTKSSRVHTELSALTKSGGGAK